MTLAFHMDAETALEVYQLFSFYKAETEEQRVALLAELAANGYPITVFETSRTPDEIAKDHAKHGNVLYVKDIGDKSD